MGLIVNTGQDLSGLVNQECNALISAQVATVCASDARAAGLLAASATIAGIAFAAIAALSTRPDLSILAAGCWGAAVVALGSAGAALWAVWPIQLLLPGWAPSDFETDIGKTPEEIVSGMLFGNQQKIDNNRHIIDEMHRRSLLSVVLLAYTPLGAMAGALCTFNSVAIGAALVIWLGLAAILFIFFVPRPLRTPR